MPISPAFTSRHDARTPPSTQDGSVLAADLTLKGGESRERTSERLPSPGAAARAAGPGGTAPPGEAGRRAGPGQAACGARRTARAEGGPPGSAAAVGTGAVTAP